MKVAILGAGTVGASLAKLLCKNDKISAVIVIDQNGNALSELESFCQSSKLRTYRVSIAKQQSLLSLIKGFDCMISALPHSLNYRLTKFSKEVGINYIDLGGDDKLLEKQLGLNDREPYNDSWIIPNSGLAPGLVNILAMHSYEELDKIESIKIWSASLPIEPKPPFNYQLSFSPVGLMREYVDPVTILNDGEMKTVNPLDGYEKVSFESKPELNELEAFYISGSITSLVKSLEGKVKELTHKTLRYSGHRDIIKALMDLGFGSDQIIDIRTNLTFQELLVRQFQRHLPRGQKDFVIVKLVIEGKRKGENIRRDYELIHEYDEVNGISAMMAATAIPTIIIAELIAEHKLIGDARVAPPEQVVPKEEFLNRLKEKGLDIRMTETVLSLKA
jgi:lysine 6-dehydrogenase